MVEQPGQAPSRSVLKYFPPGTGTTDSIQTTRRRTPQRSHYSGCRSSWTPPHTGTTRSYCANSTPSHVVLLLILLLWLESFRKPIMLAFFYFTTYLYPTLTFQGVVFMMLARGVWVWAAWLDMGGQKFFGGFWFLILDFWGGIDSVCSFIFIFTLHSQKILGAGKILFGRICFCFFSSSFCCWLLLFLVSFLFILLVLSVYYYIHLCIIWLRYCDF